MIYLDNAATTKPSKAALDAMMSVGEMFGNPSSLHGLGLAAEKAIKEAKAQIASKLNCSPNCIYFTSGGTEANNTIIFGVANARKKWGTHLVTSKIEHPSVLEAFKRLEREGFSVTYLDADNDGRVSISDIKNAVTDKTTLISIMYVNNETGVIQPVDMIKDAISDIAKNAFVHSDCVQAFGKINVNVKKMKLEFATISAHKIHAFKGVGAMYISDTRFVTPLIYGGEQQSGLRPGTENVGGILAFGAAAKDIKTDTEKFKTLREHFKSRLINEVPDIVINGSDEFNSNTVLNVSFLGIKAEILLHALEAKGVYVSTGSACSSHKPQPSHVLVAMGKNDKEVGGAVRFSFSYDTSILELDEAVEIIKSETAMIRRFM